MFIDWLLYYFVSRLSLHCSGFCFMLCSHVTSYHHRTVFFNQSLSFQRKLSCPSEFRWRPSPITMSEVAFLFAYMIYVNFSREHGPPPITLSEVVYLRRATSDMVISNSNTGFSWKNPFALFTCWTTLTTFVVVRYGFHGNKCMCLHWVIVMSSLLIGLLSLFDMWSNLMHCDLFIL